MSRLRLCLIALVLVVVGCAHDPTASHVPPRITALPRALTAQEQQLIQADNRLAIKLLKELDAETRDTLPNLFISPLSVATALAMTYNGAAGTTADAMRATLELDSMSVADVNDSYRSLIQLLRHLDPHVQFQIANSIWYKQHYDVEQPFLAVNHDYYDAQVTALDFASPTAPATINDWVSTQTHGIIDRIIDQIPDYMRLYLIDAIYFKGDWTTQFDKTRTAPGPFRLESGAVVNVPTMARGMTDLRTAFRPYATIIDLPYGGAAFSMTIVVPRDTTSVTQLVNALTLDQWNGWIASLNTEENELFMPKFKLTNDLGLIPALSGLGMGIAFSDRADFTRIHTPSELAIDEVRHKSYVDVNEEGTVAAAVTEVGIGITSVGSGPVVVDRPFLFALRENLSGTILFMGVMRQPPAN